MKNPITSLTDLITHTADVLLEKLLEWYDLIILHLPNIIVATLIVIVSRRLAFWLRRVAERTLPRMSKNVIVQRGGASGIYYFVLTLGIFTALNLLQLDKAVMSLLAGAGILGLALGFAFQDLATNFISGIFIVLQEPFKIHDFVDTNGYQGHIEKIGLRSITLRTLDGQHVVIPSKDIFQNPLKNYEYTPERRITLNVGVTYDANLEFVRDLSRQVIAGIPQINEQRGVSVTFEEFGDSSINFSARFWINYSDYERFLQTRSDVIIALKKAFDENGITIPFPIRTIDFPSLPQALMEQNSREG